MDKVKKHRENKKPTSKGKIQPPGKCKNCNNRNCPGALEGTSIAKTKPSLATRLSKTSVSSKKGSKMENKECICPNLSVLDLITDDKICMCDVFAKALRSDIHMNIGTLVHQERQEPTVEHVEGGTK